MKTSEILRNAAWYELWDFKDSSYETLKTPFTCIAIERSSDFVNEWKKAKYFYEDLYRSGFDMSVWAVTQLEILGIHHFEEQQIQNVRATMLFLAADIAESEGD